MSKMTAEEILAGYNVKQSTINHNYGYVYEVACNVIDKLLSDRDTHARQMAVDEKIKTIGFVKKIIHEMDWGVMDNDIDAHELLIRLDTFTQSKGKEEQK